MRFMSRSLVLGVLARRAGTTAVVPARDFRGGLLLLSRGRALLSQGGALLSRGCLLSRGRLLVQIVVRPELRAGDVGRRHQAFVADRVELLPFEEVRLGARGGFAGRRLGRRGAVPAARYELLEPLFGFEQEDHVELVGTERQSGTGRAHLHVRGLLASFVDRDARAAAAAHEEAGLGHGEVRVAGRLVVELLGVRLLFEQLLERLVGTRRELGLVLRDLVRGGLVLALLYRERRARAERR